MNEPIKKQGNQEMKETKALLQWKQFN